MIRVAYRSILVVFVVIVTVAASDAAAPQAFVERVAATGVWSWTTRTKRLEVQHWSDGELWRQTWRSVERQDPSTNFHRSVVLIESPAIMRGMRVLSIMDPLHVTAQWLYIPELRKPRRLPPPQRGAFLDQMFGPLVVLRELALRLRRSDELRYEAVATGHRLHVRARYGEPNALELYFSEPRLLLTHVIVLDSDLDVEYVMYLNDYRDVQAIPTPHRMTVVHPGASVRTVVEFDEVAYNVPMADEIFLVSRFGEIGMPFD